MYEFTWYQESNPQARFAKQARGWCTVTDRQLNLYQTGISHDSGLVNSYVAGQLCDRLVQLLEHASKAVLLTTNRKRSSFRY